LYHSDAVAERVLSAIARAAPHALDVKEERAADDDTDQTVNEQSADDSQLFIVRLVHDECELSADSSGALLHRRGYRREVAKAPLRETLAAAMVLGCGWRPTEALLDPMCGSGTIPIEAAMIANDIAPGMRREFAFMHWPNFHPPAWETVLGRARDVAESAAASGDVGEGAAVIVGSDRDEGAIVAAKRNAERAGVAGLISWRKVSLSESINEMSQRDAGWLLANPPYGVRLGDTASLRNLYATLGRLSAMRPDWRTGVLTAERELARQLGIPLRERFSTRNGGIPVTFFVSANVRNGGRK
jgi:putative N6-adenine-specific DNA methylase